MPELKWDENGKRYYETGVDHGVVYPHTGSGYGTGVAWNGLTAFNESPSGAEANAIYADNMKYLNLISAEDYGFSLEAYTYPDEFAECDGSVQAATGVFLGQQVRKMFGFVCRTKIGNDETDDLGYKLHIIYGCKAAPTEKNYNTVNDSPEAGSFSWEISTTPVPVKNRRATACVTIDSRTADEDLLKALEAMLFGTDPDEEAETPGSDPTLPDIETVISMMTPTPTPPGP